MQADSPCRSLVQLQRLNISSCCLVVTVVDTGGHYASCAWRLFHAYKRHLAGLHSSLNGTVIHHLRSLTVQHVPIEWPLLLNTHASDTTFECKAGEGCHACISSLVGRRCIVTFGSWAGSCMQSWQAYLPAAVSTPKQVSCVTGCVKAQGKQFSEFVLGEMGLVSPAGFKHRCEFLLGYLALIHFLFYCPCTGRACLGNKSEVAPRYAFWLLLTCPFSLTPLTWLY